MWGTADTGMVDLVTAEMKRLIRDGGRGRVARGKGKCRKEGYENGGLENGGFGNGICDFDAET